MRVLVRFKTPVLAGGTSETTQIMHPGDWTVVSLPSAHLVSAGQSHQFSVRVEIQAEEGEHRPLADILAEAIQHGKDNPTHGGNCACLDGLLWELKRQINSVIPSSADEPDWERRNDARWRVTYLMNVASRYL
jgi:hypothetical protein